MDQNTRADQLSAQINQAGGIPLNRAQRRASKKTANVKAKPSPFTAVTLLERARAYEPGEMIAEHIITREAFNRLIDNTGETKDFDRVSMMMNVGLVRARDIHPDLVKIMLNGQFAFAKLRDGFLKTGNFVFDKEGKETVAQALDAYEMILDSSSPLQMIEALRVVYKQLTNKNIMEFINA